MTSPYEAVFLLPIGAQKRLGDCGWEFSSSKRLPRALLLSLASTLRLEEGNSYLGMEVYHGEGLKLTAIADRRGIEHIFIQIWSRPKQEIEKAVACDEVEVFTP
ncbi:hypothetical protein [Massilia horti]|uniref:Uncharacterized protein n=1 Tax=Massilia horti TaxID=2562153 RepID=A0A4Y9T480_9BURK|nr:hypothetical protein [Massilia horti]TFW34989.1 hypothetical protein E4O92_02590 [Massilia horti]